LQYKINNVVISISIFSILFGVGYSLTGCGSSKATATKPQRPSLIEQNRLPGVYAPLTDSVKTDQARHEWIQKILDQHAEITFKVKKAPPGSNPQADNTGLGSVQLTHRDPVTGENCQVQTSEFHLSFCCISMLHATFSRNSIQTTSTPEACISSHFGELTQGMTLDEFGKRLLGGTPMETYHFEHVQGGLSFIRLYSNPDYDPQNPSGDKRPWMLDNSVFQFSSVAVTEPEYEDPAHGDATRRNNLFGTWKLEKIKF